MIGLAQTHFIDRAGAQILRCLYGDAPETKAPNYRILIVDDDEGTLLALRKLFSSKHLSHCIVHTAESANQAMALIATHCFDLAIIDYRLGSGTAMELVNMWRDHGYQLPFICISGFPDVEREVDSMGASGFLPKSDITPERMAEFIRRAVAASFAFA